MAEYLDSVTLESLRDEALGVLSGDSESVGLCPAETRQGHPLPETS
jgi:hypothetical protein